MSLRVRKTWSSDPGRFACAAIQVPLVLERSRAPRAAPRVPPQASPAAFVRAHLRRASFPSARPAKRSGRTNGVIARARRAAATVWKHAKAQSARRLASYLFAPLVKRSSATNDVIAKARLAMANISRCVKAMTAPRPALGQSALTELLKCMAVTTMACPLRVHAGATYANELTTFAMILCATRRWASVSA